MDSSKEIIRQNILHLRKKMNADEVFKLSAKISKYLFESDIFTQAESIMIYASYPNEVITDNIIAHAIKLKKNVSVPICNRKTVDLFPSLITDLNMLEKGYFGLREPKKDLIAPFDAKVLDLIIVPGVAFDKKGNRIGHGKGYYDRFFNSIPSSVHKVALAFQYQIVNKKWNIEPWDIQMDAIITENGWIHTNL